MYEACLKEKISGRVPLEIEFFYALLPTDLASRLHEAKSASSKEVTPNKQPS
jgi:hypothetical protein